jgi:hypothetical protein
MAGPKMQRLSKEQYPMMWGSDAQTFESNGDYQWMAEQIGEGPVLEIGCGIGLSTNRLAKRGPLMSIDHNRNCLEATEKYLASTGIKANHVSQGGSEIVPGSVSLLEADVFELSPWQKDSIASFSPKWIVCWLIGSYSDVVQQHAPDVPREEAVALYREKLEVALAQLANSLPSVQGVHYVHRIQMPWNKKDEGRSETARVFNEHVFPETSFATSKERVLFRKWQIRDQASGIVYASREVIDGAIPCLLSVLGARQ